jgi:hypothetical protein
VPWQEVFGQGKGGGWRGRAAEHADRMWLRSAGLGSIQLVRRTRPVPGKRRVQRRAVRRRRILRPPFVAEPQPVPPGTIAS